MYILYFCFCFFKQKTAYEMRISDWSSDVCSSDLKVTEPLARRITETVAIPTIGIGASAACDGQVLVIDDILGMFQGFQPKFVKRYAELGRDAAAGAAAFAEEARSLRLPGPERVSAHTRECRTSQSSIFS